jgi:hypothetical protein
MITDRLQTGDATISADATFDDGPFIVHGIAQAAEVTQGVSGQRRYWPPEVLEDAAKKLVGTPIVDPDDHRALDAGQPHPEIIVGEVTDAAFDADREALVYEAEIDDPDRARQIARGRVDVSPSVALEPGEQDPERDAERVAAVVDYRDLAIVADGAHASASIQPGTAEALARHFNKFQRSHTEDADSSPTENRDTEHLAAVEDVQQGTLVRWSSSGDRPAYGRIEEIRTESDAPLDGEIDGDQTVQPPAALVKVHRPDGDGGWQPSGTMAGHTLNTDTLTIIDELPDPESLANHRDGDDGSRGSTGQSLPDDETQSDPLMDDITDEERELLAASRQLDDPTVVETDAAERLSDHEELIEAADGIDEPTVVSESDYETLEARVDEVREVLADALQEQTGLSDTAIEAMPFEALATEFETDDGALNVEALAQNPETGSGPSDPNLSDEKRERKGEIEERLETLSGEDNVIAEREMERLESELETITGGDA